MIRFVLIFGAMIAGVWWLVDTVLSNPGTATITWGGTDGQMFKMTTATLLLAVTAACITFYILLRLLINLLGFGKRVRRMRDARLAGKASRGLNQGLIQLAEGHWDKAERVLTEHAEHSEAPLLNYLTAARAAHMRNQPERRDELLKLAIENDGKAQIAVGVSQAEMQLGDSQLEQAHATLLTLRNIAPKNTYVLKLYAKTLYRQENWDELLKLLPELVKHKLLDNNNTSKNMKAVQSSALRGAFAKYAAKQEADKLQLLWKKIPAPIKEQTETMQLYAKSLHKAREDKLCSQFIVAANTKKPNDKLTEIYSHLYHPNLEQAIKQGEKWLSNNPENPTNLILLARLHRQQKLWDKAKSYYENSLNQSPNPEGYLELAELLEAMGESENAQQCYQTGLRYSIRKQGERLVLGAG
uniref:HemY protein n=1 Tax=uncultured Thiotrichaceae bacterium TaxID=298394 RepID=A0A6S6UJ11_9GAMM|nr:MAG: HemY protein [uncultured Thiotrichaceae bacterium]